MATQLITTSDMCDLGLVFRAVRSSHLPSATQLRAVGSLETYREISGHARRLPRTRVERAMVAALSQDARLRELCMGNVPQFLGMPQTSIATTDGEIVSL